MKTKDGFQYLPETGFTQGLPTEAVVSPPAKIDSANGLFDTVIVGAGYAGLIAARNLSLQGGRTLLLEARDRIGGRTWTSEINGYKYEMGGNWVHWGQPHVFAEMSRYSMTGELVSSSDPNYEANYCTTTVHGFRENISHQEEEDTAAFAMETFCDVDGQGGRAVMPFPHSSFTNNSALERWDKTSCRERISQIKNKLSPQQLAFLESNLLHISGGTLDNTSTAEILHWWSLCDYRNSGITEYGLMYKLRCGQTGLAGAVFNEAVTLGKLQYKFSAPVAAIHDLVSHVEVKTRAGQVFRSKAVVSSIPLNVLGDLEFRPPLSASKASAVKTGHINKATKTHYEVSGTAMRSWSGIAYPGKGQMYAYGDGLTPQGNAHIIAFGHSPELHSNGNAEDLKASLLHFHDADIRRVVYHDWNTDEFSQGTWAVYSPEFVTKYHAELQKPSGRIYFASADWADGWRGFIDGAIEQGVRSALAVSRALCEEQDGSKKVRPQL